TGWRQDGQNGYLWVQATGGGSRGAAGSAIRCDLASLFHTWTARGLNPLTACLHALHTPSPLPLNSYAIRMVTEEPIIDEQVAWPRSPTRWTSRLAQGFSGRAIGEIALRLRAAAH